MINEFLKVIMCVAIVIGAAVIVSLIGVCILLGLDEIKETCKKNDEAKEYKARTKVIDRFKGKKNK